MVFFKLNILYATNFYLPFIALKMEKAFSSRGKLPDAIPTLDSMFPMHQFWRRRKLRPRRHAAQGNSGNQWGLHRI